MYFPGTSWYGENNPRIFFVRLRRTRDPKYTNSPARGKDPKLFFAAKQWRVDTVVPVARPGSRVALRATSLPPNECSCTKRFFFQVVRARNNSATTPK